MTSKDQTRQALTNYIGKENYTPVYSSSKEKQVLEFIRLIKNKSLGTILRVGFSSTRYKVVDSSRAISSLSTVEYCIDVYIKCLTQDFRLRHIGSEHRSDMSNPNYKLYVFFIYLYFVCPPVFRPDDASKQSILDMMLAYSITKRYTLMLEFIFCVIVCERQLYDTPLRIKCSQYEDLDTIIKSFDNQKDNIFSTYENSTIDKVYIDSYTDSYSEALEYQNELEKEFDKVFKTGF